MWNRGLQCFKLNGNQTEKIDIWKKITFYFLQNVWKCTVFSHLHFKFAKSAIMTQKFVSWKLSLWVSKTCRILRWFQIHWCRLSEMPLTKVKSKKPRKNAQKQKTQNSHSFLALAFFRGIFCSSRHQRIWNQHKILRVFDTHIDIFQEIFGS
jgi:hypothetical protein